MDWFAQIRQVLRDYYFPDRPADIVGYLRGNDTPGQWRAMASAGYYQFLILGNTEPTPEEWVAAGVAQRDSQSTITTGMLSGFIVLYGGFMLRPWGRIHTMSGDALTLGFPGSLRDWRVNYRPPGRRH
jgi:hypothetical protein